MVCICEKLIIMTTVSVILLENVPRLGDIGNEVKVRSGYARNHLLPTKKAVYATSKNIAEVQSRRAEIESNEIIKKTHAEDVAVTISNITKLEIVRQADDNGHLYGAVTARDIVKSLHDRYSIDVLSDSVVISDKIKAIGEYSVELILHAKVTAKLNVDIVRSSVHAV